MDVRLCTYAELSQEPNFKQLIAAYADEAALVGMPAPNPDYATYAKLDQLDTFVVLGAFLQGKLVGFISMYVVQLPHYSELVATTESFFVDSQYRKTNAGHLLRSRARMEAQQRGAIGIFFSAAIGGKLERILAASKDCNRTHSTFFERFGE